MSFESFENDDTSYLAWLAANPTGFVINLRKQANPSYVVLHTAKCPFISRPLKLDGGYTERNYRKVVAGSIQELKLAAKDEGRLDGSFSAQCSFCNPTD